MGQHVFVKQLHDIYTLPGESLNESSPVFLAKKPEKGDGIWRLLFTEELFSTNILLALTSPYGHIQTSYDTSSCGQMGAMRKIQAGFAKDNYEESFGKLPVELKTRIFELLITQGFLADFFKVNLP